MTIHHDKLAYGKLASMREDLSEDKLLKMLETLANDSGEEEKTAEKEGGKKKEEK